MADLSKQGYMLRHLLTPRAATALAKAAAAAFNPQHNKGWTGAAEQGQAASGSEAGHGGLNACGFNVAQLEGILALDEIEQLVAQVRSIHGLGFM